MFVDFIWILFFFSRCVLCMVVYRLLTVDFCPLSLATISLLHFFSCQQTKYKTVELWIHPNVRIQYIHESTIHLYTESNVMHKHILCLYFQLFFFSSWCGWWQIVLQSVKCVYIMLCAGKRRACVHIYTVQIQEISISVV